MVSSKSKINLVEKETLTKKVDAFSPGDTVKVHVKIKEGDKERVQLFEGVVMGFSNTGARKTFTVRKISHGVGVERVFPLYTPSVVKVEVASVGRVRRAKINYIRGLAGKAAKIKSESDFQG